MSVLASSLPSVVPHRDQVDAIRRQAIASFQAGDYGRAIGLYEDWSKLDPDNVPVLKDLMGALLNQRSSEAAEEGVKVATRLTELRPSEPQSWNCLGQMEYALGHPDAAIHAYTKSLELNPRQTSIQLAIAKVYSAEREFQKTVHYLEPLRGNDGDMAELYPLLAKAQFWTQQYAESLGNWAQAVRLFPDQLEYQFYESQALYYAGQLDEARAKLRTLAFERHHPKAFDLLVDDALSRGDLITGEGLLEDSLKQIQPADEPRVMKLATIYQKNGQNMKWGRILDRFLDVWPDHILALQMKADQLFELHQTAEALQLYRKVHKLNPNSIPALLGIADCQVKLKNTEEASRALKKLRACDPTNAYYLLKQAQFIFDSGDHRRAKLLVTGWVSHNRKTQLLPVLLYHGLTPFPQDPLLAVAYHDSIVVFEDHIRALHDAGYTPVTASQVTVWYKRHVPLPTKPVMITFDDGRLDSLQFGDPILKKYGFKATMFEAVVNIEGHRPPGYAPWNRLREYQDTGRWEIQSHGDLAHIYIPTSPDGKRGLFLISRQWLDGENRSETIEEWQERVDDDYQSSKSKIMEHLDVLPSAYAFPEGYFGQDGNSNVAQAGPVNMALVLKHYQTAYSQDDNGLNFGTRDPALLNRFIPYNDWTGEDLLKHFEKRNPLNEMYMQMLEWAILEGHTRDALRWLKELESNGVSKSTLLTKESQIHFMTGESAKAQELVQEALMLDNLPEIRRIFNIYAAQNGSLWTPSYSYQEDNEDRRNWIFNQAIDVGRTGPVNWTLHHEHGEYWQHNAAATVSDNAGGVSGYAPLGLFHHVGMEFYQHFFSGQAHNTYSGSATLESVWTNDLRSRLEVGRSLYDTALALDSNVSNTYGDALVRWSQGEPWRVSSRETYGSLSDGNRRETFWVETSKTVFSSPILRAVYRFTYDDMQTRSKNYYSPQELWLNGLGPEVSYRDRGKMEFYFRYLPVIAVEQGQSCQIDHSVTTYLILHYGEKISLKPSYIYYETPSYHENRYMTEFSYRF